MRLTGDSLLLTPTWYMVVHRWSSQRGGEGEEGGGEAPGGWDCAGVPAGLSWGGVRRQPPVPGPRSLPAEVWQLLFTLALQECLLQSLLHQISLNTDTGGAKECVCSCMCVCVCRWRFLWWQPVWVCVCLCVPCACEGESDTRSILDKNHQRVTKRHIWSPTLEIGLICVYCMFMRVPRYTHAIMLVIEPVEEECVFPLYIHRLSLLRSHRPSCRTLLSYCISPLFTLGSSSVTTPARHCPTWPCGCFCPEWRFFFFVNGNLQRVPHSCEPTVSCYCRW